MNSQKTLSVARAGDLDVVITRRFDAPPALVFDAHTKPDLIRRWLLGPPGWSMPVCQVDLRPGGTYRYTWRNAADGTEMGIHGTFAEVEAPARLVQTETFEPPWYPGSATVTSTFTASSGGTELKATVRYESTAARDAVFNSGMVEGLGTSYDRLDGALAASG